MAQHITRTQTVNYDDVTLMAVQGPGTDKFDKANAPKTPRANFGACFSGRLRVTRLASGKGYNFLLVDAPRKADRKRVHFTGDAQVRLGGTVVTVDAYWRMLEDFDALRRALTRD